MSPGRRGRGCSGVLCSMCWRRGARSSWSTPSISKRCRGAKRTSRTARGWRTRHAPGPATPQFYPAAAHPQPIRVLRDLTRYRKSLVQLRTQEINRVHKVLETANLKLGAVASNVVGVSGRRMLRAVEHGESDPAVLAELAKGRLREKLPTLRLALAGPVATPQREVICELLAH